MSFWNELGRPIRVLAPMEDFTDAALRELLLQSGRPDVFFTEFINCDGFCSAGRDAVDHRLRFSTGQHPIVAQIWGNTPETYHKTASCLQQLGFDGIDINIGCSVPKVLKNGTCAALIKQPKLVAELYNAAREGAPQLPISIKTRLGFDSIDTERWIGFLLKLKPDAIVIHGRTAKQQLRGYSNWNEISYAVELRNAINPDSVIIGNGDIHSQAELTAHAEKYGVDGVMVGRAIIANPFFFAPPPADSTLMTATKEFKINLLLKHYLIFRNTWGRNKDLRVMNKFIKPYLFGFSGAAELRRAIIEAKEYDEIVKILGGGN